MTTPRDINDLPKGRSDMRFIETVKEKLGLGLREFSRAIGISHQLLATWIEGAPKMKDFVMVVCKIRKISGLSWNQFGKMLDDEFLDKDKNK